MFGLALLGCTGNIDEPDPDGPDPDPEVMLPAFAPIAPNLPRLTEAQYRNTLTEVFGEPLPAFELEADTNPHLFFSIGAAQTTISERGVDQYEIAATQIARALFLDVERRDALVGCSLTADGCARSYVERLGRRLFRRPLEADEVDRWLLVAAIGDDPQRGLEYVTSGMLQAPSFSTAPRWATRRKTAPARSMATRSPRA